MRCVSRGLGWPPTTVATALGCSGTAAVAVGTRPNIEADLLESDPSAQMRTNGDTVLVSYEPLFTYYDLSETVGDGEVRGTSTGEPR